MVSSINKRFSNERGEENSVIVGKNIYKESETIKLFSKEYRVKGVNGAKDEHVYNDNVYIGLKDMPDEIKRRMKNETTFEMIVRSNEDPKREIDTFIRYLKQNRTDANAKVINEKENYEKEKARVKLGENNLLFRIDCFL